MTRKVDCDWCCGGSNYTDCGNETCDHCGGSCKIKFSKTQLVAYGNFDGDAAMGIAFLIPIYIKILLGFRFLEVGGNRNLLPLIVVTEIEIS